LIKRQNVDDLTCVFCNEVESCQHLFFECVVAAKIWREIGIALDINIKISNMHDIASLSVNKKKNCNINIIFAAVLRAIWITRNDFIFKRSQWLGMQGLWKHLVGSCVQWKILVKEGREELMMLLNKLKASTRRPLLLWPEPG
jgi:hypothetical protein